MKKLIELIYSNGFDNWKDDCQDAFNELFGSSDGRYSSHAQSVIKLRAPFMSSDSGVSYAALIDPSNPDSGPYGGMCFVIFPIEDGPCLICLGIGTQGLSPDEQVLGKPGHARKTNAICAWLNQEYGKGEMVAWAKQDPVRTEIEIPKNIQQKFPGYNAVFKRYGGVLYAVYAPNGKKEGTENAIKAFLDLMFEERGYSPLSKFQEDSNKIKSAYFSYLMPDISMKEMKKILDERHYVIVEGPPGTGKTEMAISLIKDEFKGNGMTIQFHPNTTYENFVGGLAPIQSEEGMGFKFAPKKGFLMEAVDAANKNPDKKYLLHIDEINRADLAKVLGEAIILFEAEQVGKREIELAYEFDEKQGNKLKLQENLYILGTMNTADRSIAILDVAIRRRFAFVKLWPQMKVVEEYGCNLMQKAFREIVSIFIENANEDTISLVPGHSYFLEKDENKAIKYLKLHLRPLLEEYLMQGYVAGFADSIRGYLQWLEALDQ
ncbi:MAG: AAA family ATPase [bacterium]|nr:AAA family ATPase [bacterium]